MSKVLNLSYTNAIRKINDLSDRLFGGGNIDYQLNEQISMYNAVTYRDESTGLANGVMIGTNGLQNNFGFLNHIFSISDQKFAQVIINIFHEATHCQQKNVMFQNDSPTQNDINQTISELACRGNKTYYMGQHNYIMNPNEIQAEYSGVTEAYQYLCTVFPDIDKKQHEQIILDVLNTKLQSGVSYWIHPSKDNVFTSLSDVEQAFEKAYDSLLGKDRNSHGNPADEAQQESRRMAEDLMKKAAVCQADHCKIPIPEIKYAGGYVGGSPNTATAGNARNMLYDMLTKKGGVDQKN